MVQRSEEREKGKTSEVYRFDWKLIFSLDSSTGRKQEIPTCFKAVYFGNSKGEIAMEKKYCVYVHTNKVNGKRYVGITSMCPEKRWANGRGYRSNRLFYRAVQKYGWDSFAHEILESGLTKQSACEKEVELIQLMQLTNPKYGYNLDKGGNGSNRITEKTRKRLSDGVKRYFEEHPEAKEANADRLRNLPHSTDALIRYREEHPDYRKAHGKYMRAYWAEHADVVGASRKKCREYYEKHPEARKLKSEQTRRYFDEHPEAREHAARKTREYYQNPEAKRWKSKERKRFFAEHPEKKTTKAIAQYTLEGMLIAVFASAREADVVTNVGYKKISAVVTGRQKSAGGYIWRYANELQNKAI